MDDNYDSRPVNVIRLALACAQERLGMFDPETCRDDHDFFVAYNRVQTLEDELFTAEDRAQRMAERVAQKWMHRYGPRQRRGGLALIQELIHDWN